MCRCVPTYLAMPRPDHRPRLSLANLPTPLQRFRALDALLGCELWVKRDDMTGGVETGNKVRKLEYLLADARAAAADVVLTCGGFQSNHCRATAVLARSLGMDCVTLLRTDDGRPLPLTGNALLGALAGATQYTITPAAYERREALMAREAGHLRTAGRRPYIIPEGGSNALGARGYVDAMAELRAQLDAGEAGGAPFDVVATACGSGGTAAGLSVGAGRHGVAAAVWAFAVCDDSAHFEAVTAPLVDALGAGHGAEPGPAPLRIFDAWKGPRYGVSSPEQLDFIREVAARTGLVLDPVYTGKAMYGLGHHPERPARVCFVHTGGFPGLLGTPDALAAPLPRPTPLPE